MRVFYGLLFVLAACDSPSPQLGRAEPTRIVRDGYALTVWRSGDQVEVIRHGYAPRADLPKLRGVLLQAMRDTTGCDLQASSVNGDAGVLRARLDCKG